MIIVRMYGGLGNQLFQLACGIALSRQLNSEILLDCTWYRKKNKFNTPRKCSIKDYKTSIRDANILDRIKLFPNKFVFKNFIYKTIEEKKPYYHFDKSIFKNYKNIYLDGYWQSYKYFSDVSDVIRDIFCDYTVNFAEKIPLKFEIENTNSISLHVRRGDYIDPNNGMHLLDMNYYNQSINYVNSLVKNPHYFIFTDDMDWVRKHFRLENSTIVESFPVEDPRIDLHLMSKCKHNIIANSTYSWWGAWLNRNSGKIVISPKNWFKDGRICPDLIPDEWVKF